MIGLNKITQAVALLKGFFLRALTGTFLLVLGIVQAL